MKTKLDLMNMSELLFAILSSIEILESLTDKSSTEVELFESMNVCGETLS